MKPAPKNLSGLQKICRAMGGMKVNGMSMVWDYAREEAVLESELRADKERWAASERIKWSPPAPETAPPQPADQ